MAFTLGRAATRLHVPAPESVLRWLHAALCRRRRRAEIAALLKLSDHRLDDIGITRGDIRYALSRDGDPAPVLHRARRARSRAGSAR